MGGKVNEHVKNNSLDIEWEIVNFCNWNQQERDFRQAINKMWGTQNWGLICREIHPLL